MGAPMTVVHIVDDQPGMLKMVAELVGSVPLTPITYSSASEFLDRYSPRETECLVSDVRMPVIGGLEFLRLVRQRGYTLPILFITGYAEVGTAVEAMRAGAFDYIEKPFSHQAFLDKVQQAIAASASLYNEGRQQRVVEARLSLLTPTERKILVLVAQGKSSREIGDELSISPRTVDNHRSHMMEKLHVNSVVELVLVFTGSGNSQAQTRKL
jgi:two-component system, LuxR family, response regulator FixJ